MRWACIVALLLPACATPDASRIYGAWRSNEPLTLEQVATAELTPDQRELLTEPGFWGELQVTYEEGRVLTELDGCSWYSPYRVVAAAEDTIVLEYMDSLTGEIVHPTLILRGEQLLFPIPHLGFYEIFTRVDSSDRTPACEQASP